MRNNRGFSLVEVLVAIGLLGVGIAGLTSLIISEKKSIARNIAKRNMDLYYLGLVEQIQSDMNSFQVSYFSTVTDLDNFLNPATLPLGFDGQSVHPIASCPTCPAKIGVAAMPHYIIRSNYHVKIRIVDPRFFTPYRDFEFIVSAK